MVPALHEVWWLWAGGLSPARMVVPQQVQGLGAWGLALAVSHRLSRDEALLSLRRETPRLCSPSSGVLGAAGVQLGKVVILLILGHDNPYHVLRAERS